MVVSLPSFPTFLRSAIPTPCYIVFCYLCNYAYGTFITAGVLSWRCKLLEWRVLLGEMVNDAWCVNGTLWITDLYIQCILNHADVTLLISFRIVSLIQACFVTANTIQHTAITACVTVNSLSWHVTSYQVTPLCVLHNYDVHNNQKVTMELFFLHLREYM